MPAFQNANYARREAKSASIPDPEMIACWADAIREKLLMVWAPLQDGAIALLCETGGAVKEAKM